MVCGWMRYAALPPRIYEGGGTSPLKWYRGEYAFPARYRISDYLSSSFRRGRVSHPLESRDLFGAGRETRPLRCFYGWSDKFPIFQTGALPQQACYIIGEFSGIVKQGKAGALSFILRFRQSGLIFRPGKAMLPLRSTVSVTSLYLIKGAYHASKPPPQYKKTACHLAGCL